MNAPDLSTKLKLMGVDVASFGDFFADKAMGRMQQPLVETMRNTGTPEHPNTQVLSNTHVPGEPDVPQTGKGPEVREGAMTKRVKIHVPKQEEPIKCLTYKMSYSLGKCTTFPPPRIRA
jgi:nitrite reductase (NAD(P)H)